MGLVGYGIYIWASRKSRRNDAIEGRVKKMVSNGKNHAVFNDLYFEAARTYAIEKGAKAADSTSASAHILVGGKTYFVVFSKAAGGGQHLESRTRRQQEIGSSIVPKLNNLLLPLPPVEVTCVTIFRSLRKKPIQAKNRQFSTQCP